MMATRAVVAAAGRGPARHVTLPAAFVAVVLLLWPAPLEVWVEGSILGSLIALSAFGVALVYRSSGAINLAQADLGLVPVLVFATLVSTKGWSYWDALGVALALAAGIGAAVERIVVRWFAQRPRLVLTVATLGLGSLLAGFARNVPSAMSFVDVRSPGQSLPPKGLGAYGPPFEVDWQIGEQLFGGAETWGLIAAPLTILVIVVLLRYTGVGLALRGIADSSERASLLGVPVPRLQMLVWSLATILSATSLILRGAIFGLPEETLFGPSFLLRTLAAAVIGRLERLGVIVMAGLGIGIVELSILWDQRSTNLVNPLLCAVIVIALVLDRQRQRRVGGEEAAWRQGPVLRPMPPQLRRLASVRMARLAAVVVIAVPALAVPLLDVRYVYLGTATLIIALVALSVVVLTGWAGELSLGQVGVAAVGAVVSNVFLLRLRFDPATTVLVAGVVGAGASAAIALLLARALRGLFLAVATLAVGIGASTYLLNPVFFPKLVEEGIVPRPRLLWVIPIGSDTVFYYLVLLTLGATVWLAGGVQRARTGRLLVAVRENEAAAQSFGIGVGRTRMTAYVMSGFLAGAGGGLMVQHQLVIPFDLLGPMEGVRALTMAAVGGLSSVPGAIVGAVFIKSTVWFRSFVPPGWRSLYLSLGTGGGLLFVLMVLPGGLASLLTRARDAALGVVARRHGLAVVALAGERGERASIADAARSRVAAAARGALPSWVFWMVPGARASSQLHLRGLSVSYGPVRVLTDVDLDVHNGEIVALLGTNGAGKSTLLRAVSGLVPSTGEVRYETSGLRMLGPHQIARLGVIHVPSGAAVFPSLTVEENLRLASWLHRRDRQGSADRRDQALSLFPELVGRERDTAATLSGGQQHMLKLAMAIAARPRLLLVDELSVGLSPAVVERVLQVLRDLSGNEVSVVVVEQSVAAALAVADSVYVLEKGEVTFHGPATEVAERPELLRSIFFGRAATSGRLSVAPRRADTRKHRGSVLAATNLRLTYGSVAALDDVSIEVREREILGVIGPNGAGKTSVLDVVSGFVRPESGTVQLEGRDLASLKPDERARLGLGRSFQDGRLFTALTVRQTLEVALDLHAPARHAATGVLGAAVRSSGSRADEAWLDSHAEQVMELFGLTGWADKFVAELSTGSRRVLEMACQVAVRPRVLLLDEPSAGVSQRETEALAPLLRRLRDQTRSALVVVDHDVALVAAVADRVIAFDRGRLIADGPPQEVLRDPGVVASYLGTSADVVRPQM